MSAGSLLKIDLRADLTGFGSSFFGGDLGLVKVFDEIAGDLAAGLGDLDELELGGVGDDWFADEEFDGSFDLAPVYE